MGMAAWGNFWAVFSSLSWLVFSRHQENFISEFCTNKLISEDGNYGRRDLRKTSLIPRER